MPSLYSLKGSGKQRKRKTTQKDILGNIQKLSGQASKKKGKIGDMPKFPIAGTSKGRRLPGEGSNISSSKGRRA